MADYAGHAGRTALVTGGGGGIGQAIVRHLLASGYRVASADLSHPSGDPGPDEDGLLAVNLDVTEPESVRACVARVVDEYGGVDVLVNNAGFQQHGLFLETTPETWQLLIGVNLVGTLAVTHEVLPHMVKAGSGRLINIASDAARVGSVFEAAYSAAKGGVISFTRTIAREAARHQVTANCICPGPTDTPMLAKYAEKNPRAFEALAKHVPLGRIGRPTDVAPLVTFLAGEEAGYITGQVISVSGGLTMV
jgi:2-hydroxycyclohexanecarboxyl-CoA dehydrogenase